MDEKRLGCFHPYPFESKAIHLLLPTWFWEKKYSGSRSHFLSCFRLTGLIHLRQILLQCPISSKQQQGLRKEHLNQVTSCPYLSFPYFISLSCIRLKSSLHLQYLVKMSHTTRAQHEKKAIISAHLWRRSGGGDSHRKMTGVLVGNFDAVL